jgi:inorganic pyrophosphatase
VDVFIENEAGSRTKHHHDEKNLVPLRTEEVARAYPYPYGFVIGTTALGGDGDNVDCFVLTDRPLHTGEIVACEPVALMEQVEGGHPDHNVLAVLAGEPPALPDGVERVLGEFIAHFREHQPEVESLPGRLLGRAAALAYLEASRDPGF